MLARKLGVTNQTVSKWEAGQCFPDMLLLPEIADYFEVSIDDLLGHTEKKMKRQVSLEGYLEMHGEETLRTEDDILNGIIKEQEARQVRKA